MRIGRLADRPVGRHRAPRDPAVAVEEARERRRCRARGRRSTSTPSTCGPGLERERDVAVAAHVHAGDAVDGGERARQHVDRRLAVERRVAAAPRHERGLVEEQHEAGVGQPRRRRAPRSRPTTPRATSAARRNARGAGIPGRVQRDAERERPGDLHLDPRRRALERGARRRGTRAARRARRPSKTHSGAASDIAERARSRRRGATSTSGSAPSHCASIPSRGSRAGSCGTAGSSGRQRSTSSAAATGSSCGRLPMPVATPGTSTGARRVGDMGSYSTIAHDARSEAGARRPSNGVTPGLVRSRPVVAARRVGHAPAHRGTGGRRRRSRSWSDAPRVVAAVLLWVAWAVGLLATLAPRPLDAHRAAGRSRRRSSSPRCSPRSTVRRRRSRCVGALRRDRRVRRARVGTRHRVAAANALAYGDEQRFPLRVPPALFLGPLPVGARCSSSAAWSRAPLLLLADERDRRSASSRCVVGAALVVVLGRSLAPPVAPVGGARARRASWSSTR